MSPGKKRASPEGEVTKNGTTSNKEIELSPEDSQKLAEIGKEMAAAELVLERRAQAYLEPLFAKRRPILKSIANFWPQAFGNMAGTALHLQHVQDQEAVSYLEDLWISRDKTEPRCFTLEFYFKSNPYFTDEVLKKEYKYLPTPVEDDSPIVDGITPTMLAFDWEQHVAPQAIKINWKEDAKNLTMLFPRVAGEEGDDMPADPGSFFNYFEHADDPFDIGMAIATELFPEALDFFTGEAGHHSDFDDEDEDEDEDEEEEIDLEKPRKKQKTA